ncbi:MAG: hypothetical protein HZY76_03050 [Anaerolineae bacterium]|nr:MAG: hypothetical protein HZY76_03050 [Anaerolineae bacterium]
MVTTGGALFTLDGLNDSHWRPRPVGSASRVDLVIATPDGLYAAADRGIYRSRDAGTTWSHVGDLPGAAPVQAMAVDPANPNAVFVAVLGEGVMASYDGGATWQTMGRGLEKQPVHALVIDPRAQHQLLLATGDGVWRHALDPSE